jgi:preprotein translocase subunit SecE
MASETKTKDEKPMAADAVIAPGADDDDSRESRRPTPERSAPPRSGFFTIYKKGQGYWTRMGTAASALLLALLTASFLYQHVPDWMMAFGMTANNARTAAFGVIIAFLAGFALLVWWLMNKPTNADFLIATDSEMKKVNWTSRRELIGSTKVVIIFMFLIALFLFVIDILFSYFFFLIGVLKHSPFGGGGTIGGG